MSHNEPAISNFRVVPNHPYLRALADITMSGFVVRGIKLEEGASGHLYLGFPGRKVQGGWQLVCEASNEQARARLLDRLTDYYARVLEAA